MCLHVFVPDRHPSPSSVCQAHLSLFFQALIYEHSEKNLEVELFDEDTDKDDFLGWYGFLTGTDETWTV